MKRNFLLFQMKEENSRVFAPFKHGDIVPFSAYDLVWREIIDDVDDLGPGSLLLRQFQRFNINHPTGFQARSMSTSDVVVFNWSDAYFCDWIGWKRLPDWLPERQIAEVIPAQWISELDLSPTSLLELIHRVRIVGARHDDMRVIRQLAEEVRA